jgi:hypothetical protein
LKQQLATYQQNKEAAAKLLKVAAYKPNDGLDQSELAAYATVASMMLNLDETITKN